MNTWIVVTAYIQNETLFYQLRLCVESILREVPRGDYAKLLVVDDHSPHDYEAFKKHYADDDRIVFLRLGDPLPSYYGPGGRGSGEQGHPVSDGHGVALHKGILHAKEHGATHIWSLDSDTFILDGSCLAKASKIMNSDDVIRSVGDYEGGRPDVRDMLFFEKHCLDSNGKRGDRKNEREGKTNAICGLWDLKSYDYPYNHPRGDGKIWVEGAKFENLGQSATRVVLGLWSKGFATAYFPFFWHKYVMHFGYGSLLFTREQHGKRGLGNAPDTQTKYALRSQGNYYAGFLQLRCTTREFHKHLHDLFANRSLKDTSARFNTKLLVAPK